MRKLVLVLGIVLVVVILMPKPDLWEMTIGMHDWKEL